MQVRQFLRPKSGTNRRARQSDEAQSEAARAVRHPHSTVRVLRSEDEFREAVKRAAESERNLAQRVAGRARRYERLGVHDEAPIPGPIPVPTAVADRAPLSSSAPTGPISIDTTRMPRSA